MNIIKTLQISGICLFGILLFGGGDIDELHGQDSDNIAQVDSVSNSPDTSMVWPEKRKSRETWEHLLSLPGTLIYVPFAIAYEGGEAVVDYFDEKKIIPRFRNLISQYNFRGILPKYSSRHGAGLQFFQKDYLGQGSVVDFAVTGWMRKRQRFRLRIRDIPLQGKSLLSTAFVQYRLLPNEYFYGIGPDSKKSDRTNFAHEQLNASAAIVYRMAEGLILTAAAGYDKNNILAGKDDSYPSTSERFNNKNLPGLENDIKIVSLRGTLSHDTRNRIGRTTAGHVASFGAGLFRQVENDVYGFWKYSVDIRQYVHVAYNRVFSIRVAGEINRPVSDRKIPFYYLADLGREEIIRGFQRARFRDRDYLVGSLEYHYPIWGPVDAVLFLDAGRVSDDILNEYSVKNFQAGYGGGISFFSKIGTDIQLVVGRSKETVRVYLSVNRGL